MEQNGADEKKFDNLNEENIIEFLMELTEPQIKPLVEWFYNLPRIIIKGEYTCKNCKLEQEIVIDDMMSFLK